MTKVDTKGGCDWVMLVWLGIISVGLLGLISVVVIAGVVLIRALLALG